jgi:hypothetical protein
MRKLCGPALAALAVLAVAACGSSSFKLSLACSNAVNVAHYVDGTNGTQDPQNDAAAQALLTGTKWPSPQVSAAAAAVVAALNPDVPAGGAETLNNIGLLSSVTKLLTTLKPDCTQ